MLNEAATIGTVLAMLAPHADELVLVDGGSSDASLAIASMSGARVLSTAAGRALQMNAGADALQSDWQVVVFVHADTRLPSGWADQVRGAVRRGAGWGRFDVRLQSAHPLLAVVGAMMNARSRLTGICTGDQAMFVTRPAWRAAGGFAPIRLMEDIDLSARLKRVAGRPAALRPPVLVSARRWERHGIWRTIFAMWGLRLRYFLGESPERLHQRYYGPPT
jgi:rSAM/selenodomain-associated transferase 2